MRHNLRTNPSCVVFHGLSKTDGNSGGERVDVLRLR